MRPTAILCLLLLLHSVLAQAAANLQTSPAAAAETAKLRLSILQGDGSRNSIKSKSAVQAVVEVRDEAGKSLPGAQVVFQLPASGPGASFPGGRLSQRVTTDARGQASTSGLVPNDEEGRFNIKVTASSGHSEVSMVIAQVNAQLTEVDRAKGSSKTLWILLGIAGAGAAAAGLALGGGGGSGPGGGPVAAPSVTLVPGPVTVGGPR